MNILQQNVCGSQYKTLAGGICISTLEGLTLQQYVEAKRYICLKDHLGNCRCQGLFKVAETIISDGHMKLVDAFHMCSPGAIYKSTNAKRMLLQMPLATLSVGESGKHSIYLFDKSINITLIQQALESFHRQPNCPMAADTLKKILKAAQSNQERERIRYTFCKSSGFSATKLATLYGLQSVNSRTKKVEDAMRTAEEVFETYEYLASVKEKAIHKSFGIELTSDSSSSDESEDNERLHSESKVNSTHENIGASENTELLADDSSACKDGTHPLQLPAKQQIKTRTLVNSEQLMDLLRRCNLNWFAFTEELRTEWPQLTDYDIDNTLTDFTSQIPSIGLTEKDEKCIEISRQAYLWKGQLEQMEQSDDFGSESDEEETENCHKQQNHDMQREVKLMRRRLKRQAARKVAEMRLLQRRQGKHVSKILRDCPDIGKSIEEFVKDNNVGADAWRRTGVLTFDGNRKRNKKVTFSRIKEHLEQKYNRKFGYGTVVQLCVPRNKGRISAANYKGLAKVTSRRARKGFTIRYNPDTHWSAALYRGLNKLEYTDGRNIVNLNRDDQAGFRLDTLATHSKHAFLCTSPVLTTKTDYVNSYNSTLQTTSYNFTETANTGEMCAGIVKAVPIHHKNPAQHAKDLEDIEKRPEFLHVFTNPDTMLPKTIECIRVDGGNDEGPSHEEVQFFWTLRHLQKETKALLVTTRESGSSNKNRVELQNGCLALAHCNLFMPSTLNGPVTTNDNGKVDEKKVKENLDAAIDVYIERVNGAPCGDAQIHLFKGSDSSDYQTLREHLVTFLKGKAAKKIELQQQHPEVYSSIKRVWDLRKRHMVTSPGSSKYLFYLVCCLEPSCIHPVCQQSVDDHTIDMNWYEGGPPLKYVPLPVPDPNR